MKSLYLISTLALFALSACDPYNGPTLDASGSNCTSGLAQIGIGDGYAQFLCGCTSAPADGTVVTAPGSVTCHVPAGTVVMFQYIDIHNTHQIINTGGSSFPSGQPIFPGGASGLTTAAPFDSVGTYDFEDAYDSGITGQIIVP